MNLIRDIKAGNYFKIILPSTMKFNVPSPTITGSCFDTNPVTRDSLQIIKIATTSTCSIGQYIFTITDIQNPVYIQFLFIFIPYIFIELYIYYIGRSGIFSKS